MSADTFFASGTQGQRIVIAPAERLVIVRLGRSPDWQTFDIRGLTTLVADANLALNGPPRLDDSQRDASRKKPRRRLAQAGGASGRRVAGFRHTFRCNGWTDQAIMRPRLLTRVAELLAGVETPPKWVMRTLARFAPRKRQLQLEPS